MTTEHFYTLVISKTVFQLIPSDKIRLVGSGTLGDTNYRKVLPDGTIMIDVLGPTDQNAILINQSVRSAAADYDARTLPLSSHASCLGQRSIQSGIQSDARIYGIYFFGDWVVRLPGSSYRVLQQKGTELEDCPLERFRISLASTKRMTKRTQGKILDMVERFSETCPLAIGIQQSDVHLAVEPFPYGMQISFDARMFDPIFLVYFNCCLINAELLKEVSTVATTVDWIKAEHSQRSLIKTRMPIETLLEEGDDA